MTDQQTAGFFEPADSTDPVGDAPIVLGPAPTDLQSFAPTSSDYIGEIDAAPPAVLISNDVNFTSVEEETSPEIIGSTGPSPMSAWNDEWQVTLRQRKDEENDAKGNQIELAQNDLTAFQAEREAKRESKAQKNRSDEQDKLEAIEADLENDNSWQRVVKMVELSHDSAEGSADCARMRDVLIFLKNDTDRAAILA